MKPQTFLSAQIAQALQDHSARIAFADRDVAITYGQLADLITRLQTQFPATGPIAVFGKPSATFGAAATACVVGGRGFVHLDPAMPQEVLGNILDELNVDVIFCTDTPQPGQIPPGNTCIDVAAILPDLADAPARPVVAPAVAADDPIYIVATSGTTGKPKCIPVTQISALLSYEWRDAYTPYAPDDQVGVYIFAIWEMFRPLRNGATIQFAQFNELMNPRDLVAFWQRTGVMEMLFTPSALEKALMALPKGPLDGVALKRIILNGEVVSDALIAAVRDRLPDVTLWNLYSICETHDISMTDVTHRPPAAGPVSVGVPMPHLRAVVLDDSDQECATGTPGLLHFEGPDMLGPGYINRPEETALRFRNLTINGQDMRLYDTGDQGYVDAAGEVFVIGRVAHMLKLRGHSIQTRELVDSLKDYIGFGQAVPWIKDVAGQGKALVIYYKADADEAARNAERWGLTGGQMRMPAALSKALKKALPAYCIPSYLVQLDEVPINAVSGKYDYKRLPEITPIADPTDHDGALPTVVEAAKIIRCSVADLEADQSFHAQGGDSLMAVNYVMALEEIYGRAVDFDFALNVPLDRLHVLLSENAHGQLTPADFARDGILLTGATGFLGSRVLAAAARDLPADQVIYCVIREKRRGAADRLAEIATAQGVDPARLVLIPAAIEDVQFGLDAASYGALAKAVSSVIHCAAMVNLAVDRDHAETWAQDGMANMLQFCTDAGATLRFTSTSAVFPDTDGPHPEGPTTVFDGCSGYGAAKIAAEAMIVASGVPALIVRLPSLYDLAQPNSKDIYEIIMAACQRDGTVPADLSFRMIDVHAAARFVASVPVGTGVATYNLGPDSWVMPAMIPDSYTVQSVQDWLDQASLSDAEKALIASDLTVLHAQSTFEHALCATAWQNLTGRDFATVTDPAALVEARFTSSSPR